MPKPSEILEGWVDETWRIDEFLCNPDTTQIFRLAQAVRFRLPTTLSTKIVNYFLPSAWVKVRERPEARWRGLYSPRDTRHRGARRLWSGKLTFIKFNALNEPFGAMRRGLPGPLGECRREAGWHSRTRGSNDYCGFIQFRPSASGISTPGKCPSGAAFPGAPGRIGGPWLRRPSF